MVEELIVLQVFSPFPVLFVPSLVLFVSPPFPVLFVPSLVLFVSYHFLLPVTTLS